MIYPWRAGGSQKLKPNNNIVFEYGINAVGSGLLQYFRTVPSFHQAQSQYWLEGKLSHLCSLFFSHLRSDVLFIWFARFPNHALHFAYQSSHWLILHYTDHASKPRFYFFKAPLGFKVNIHKILRHLLSNGIYSGRCGYHDGLHFYWDNTWTFRSQLEMSQPLCWSHPSSFALLGPQPEGSSTARGMM